MYWTTIICYFIERLFIFVMILERILCLQYPLKSPFFTLRYNFLIRSYRL